MGHFGGRKGQMVNFGSKTPKQGLASKNWTKLTTKPGKKRQRDKCFPLQASTCTGLDIFFLLFKEEVSNYQT